VGSFFDGTVQFVRTVDNLTRVYVPVDGFGRANIDAFQADDLAEVCINKFTKGDGSFIRMDFGVKQGRIFAHWFQRDLSVLSTPKDGAAHTWHLLNVIRAPDGGLSVTH
jgi:hypothetical protein